MISLRHGAVGSRALFKTDRVRILQHSLFPSQGVFNQTVFLSKPSCWQVFLYKLGKDTCEAVEYWGFNCR